MKHTSLLAALVSALLSAPGSTAAEPAASGEPVVLQRPSLSLAAGA